MFSNLNTGTMFSKQNQQNSLQYGAPPSLQTNHSNIFGGLQSSTIQQMPLLFGQQQPSIHPQNQCSYGMNQDQMTYGQVQPQGQSNIAPILFGLSQNATPNYFNQQQQNTFGQNSLQLGIQYQKPLEIQGNPYQSQQNMILFQQNDVNAFKDKFNILIQKLQDLEKQKSSFKQIYQQQQWQQMIQPLGQTIFSIDTTKVLETSEQLLAGQKELSRKLDNYISTLGLVQKIQEDGLEIVKKEEAQIANYQKVQQTMKDFHEFLSEANCGKQFFLTPQQYQEQLIHDQTEHLDLLTNTVDKIIQTYDKEPNMNSEELLQCKYLHLQALTHYLYMLTLKIRNINERTSAFEVKVLSQFQNDKKFDEFSTIEAQKEILNQILTEEI
ncbi:unnamed protein product [Paramecium sonneborni]|uniref:Uncharacterized protein n=1 Tax=Paramecium sonneborni TaxID=65129 RepID=A0A8S1R7Q0_9CILI|nr:unnamed protein product [Paramecium sonneborni]